MVKRKRPVRHKRKRYTRKDGTPVRSTIVNPDVIRKKTQEKKVVLKKKENTVTVQKTTKKEKLKNLNKLLNNSGFNTHILSLCNKESREKCSIVIKPNISPASQKNYPYYTDPEIVEFIVKRLEKMGFNNVKVVESDTNAVKAFKELTPRKIAKELGYKNEVFNLSKDKKRAILYKGKKIYLAETMLNADIIINVPKAKNHDLTIMTGALKNMYGTIPDYNKYRLFHKEESGLNIEEATIAVNHATPSDFTIVDFIDSVDGNEKSYYRKNIKETNFKPFPSRMLIAGKNSVAIDKFLVAKMGYKEKDIPILQEEIEEFGDFKLKNSDVKGSNLIPLKNWKKLSKLTNIKAKFQDNLPISDKIIASGIRMYTFDVIKKGKNK